MANCLRGQRNGHSITNQRGSCWPEQLAEAGDPYDLAERVGALDLERIVVRDATVRHYGKVAENPGEQLVRSATVDAHERSTVMARSLVRVHRRHSRGQTPTPRC
jgi:hypothetical protein